MRDVGMKSTGDDLEGRDERILKTSTGVTGTR
jgi:hypothetical protein